MPQASDGGQKNAGYKDRPWNLRSWDGMTMGAWFPQLLRNRFAVSPHKIPMAVLVSAITGFNSSLWAGQHLIYRRRIQETEIRDAPIFIVGHWRSGTTLLHELLIRDPRHGYPNTYQCFAPNHFLVSQRWLPRLVGWAVPKRRPMDNMDFGWSHPQEDEFALCNMGIPSPYLAIMFPRRIPQYPEYVDFQGLSADEIARWKAGFLWFLKCVTFSDAKRIVLKSPLHTARIKWLLEMFPDARFVHIVRDPYVLFPSTVNLWTRLYTNEGLQSLPDEGLEEYVFEMLVRMYEAFERDRGLVDPARFSEVRFEDLVANPVAQMERIYGDLSLGEFDGVRPALEEYAASKKGYQKNQYEIPPELRARIADRWGGYIEKYGYKAAGREESTSQTC